jgi:hypothetical protein
LLYDRDNLKQLSRKAWGIGIIFMAMGALLGGTSHGFRALITEASNDFLWKGTVYTVGFSVFFMLAGTIKASLPELKWRKPFYIYNGLAFLIYSLWMINHDGFIFVILDYIPALLLILGLQVWSLYKHKTICSKWIIAGVLASFIGAGVQVGHIGFHFHFNHNDFYHVIQMVGLFFFYKGVINMKDFGASGA